MAAPRPFRQRRQYLTPKAWELIFTKDIENGLDDIYPTKLLSHV